jgi:hypothetical protein
MVGIAAFTAWQLLWLIDLTPCWIEDSVHKQALGRK